MGKHHAVAPGSAHRIGHYCVTDHTIVGEGAYGKVHCCTDVLFGTVAIKMPHNDARCKQKVHHEGELLKWLRQQQPAEADKYIVRCLDTFVHADHPCLVLEYLSGDLGRILKARRRDLARHPSTTLSRPTVLLQCHFLCAQLFPALQFLREHGIIHGDVKPDNIMFTHGSGRIKLIDFGFALANPEQRDLGVYPYELLQTRWYRAPEVMRQHAFLTCDIDMWSAACVMMEMTSGTGMPLFPGDDEVDQERRVTDLLGPVPLDDEMPTAPPPRVGAFLFAQLPPPHAHDAPADPLVVHFIDLVARLLTHRAIDRFTPAEAMQHPYMTTPVRT